MGEHARLLLTARCADYRVDDAQCREDPDRNAQPEPPVAVRDLGSHHEEESPARQSRQDRRPDLHHVTSCGVAPSVAPSSMSRCLVNPNSHCTVALVSAAKSRRKYRSSPKTSVATVAPWPRGRSSTV